MTLILLKSGRVYSEGDDYVRDFRFVLNDENRRKAIYLLGNMKLKGFVSEHGTDGLYWFNTIEGLDEKKRDLLVSSADVKVLM